MGRSKKQEATAVAEPEAPKASPAPLEALNPIAAALSPTERAAVEWVEAHRWVRTPTGTRVKRTPALAWEVAGERTTRLEAWGEVTTAELSSLWGGGELSVCCRNARGIVRWVALTLEGPEPLDESPAPRGAEASSGDGAPTAAGVVPIAVTAGVFPMLEGLEPVTRALWVLSQQNLLLQQRAHERELAMVRAAAEERVRDQKDFTRAIVECVGNTANTAQTLSQSFFAAVQAQRAPEAEPSSGKTDKGALKVILKLLEKEREQVDTREKRLEEFRDKLTEALRKPGAKKEELLEYFHAARDILKEMPEAAKAWKELSDANAATEAASLEAQAQAEAERRFQAERRALEAQAVQRMDPTAQPGQAPAPEVPHGEANAQAVPPQGAPSRAPEPAG